MSTKQRWNAEIKNIKGEQGDTLSDDVDIARTFNDLFINVGVKLADRMKKIYGDSGGIFGPRIRNDETEIMNIITSLMSKKAPGIDGITLVMFKKVKFNTIGPVVYIANLSMKTGIFPDVL